MPLLDPHSYCDSDQPGTTELDWDAAVDFSARTIDATVTLTLERPCSAGQPLDLDTRDLRIHKVSTGDGREVPFTLDPAEDVRGARLRLSPPAGANTLRIQYSTSPQSLALQWLEPRQTAGGQHPFLFSQCQPIHARSILPCQDTPRVRIRYKASLRIPSQLRALMAASAVSRSVEGDQAVERFEMPQPIPPYLFALAVGDLESRDLGPRSRVWAEPSVVESAAWEFAATDQLVRTAESMFGPYDWERFDLLTMPPSFPYGGMENPRLTFVTPTLLAGDRSMVNIIAHELAHSWTGNLVTNASAEHFWLNEGFTVFAERRILQAVEGADMCALHAALGFRSLQQAVESFQERPQLTKLRTRLQGVDPDEVYSQVPYEKGYLFLRTLEEAVGADAFTDFLRQYIERFRFQSITSEDFVELLREKLPRAAELVDLEAWLEGNGIPAGAPVPRSSRLRALKEMRDNVPSEEQARAWSPVEWQLYLEFLPRPCDRYWCEELDQSFALTQVRNYDTLLVWLEVAVEAGYDAVLPRARQVLAEVGRLKYLRPLYRVLAQQEDTRGFARECFEAFRDRYHPIARNVIAGVLERQQALT